MREELQQRLDEINELVQQRNEIDAQLARLLGLEKETQDEPQPTSQKRTRKCSGCGSTDHQISTCPKDTRHPLNPVHGQKSTPNGTPKPCCGSVGARHLKTCPKNNEKRTTGYNNQEDIDPDSHKEHDIRSTKSSAATNLKRL